MIYPTSGARWTEQTDDVAAQGRPPGMMARPYMVENPVEAAGAGPAEPFTAEFLKSVKDPAGLIQSRLQALEAATPAVVRSAAGGDPQPLNPAQLSTSEQAQAMLARLRQLGLPVEEVTGGSFPPGPFSIEYGNESRRPYAIAGMNVGALLRLYAAYPQEVADQMILDEWRRLSSA